MISQSRDSSAVFFFFLDWLNECIIVPSAIGPTQFMVHTSVKKTSHDESSSVLTAARRNLCFWLLIFCSCLFVPFFFFFSFSICSSSSSSVTWNDAILNGLFFLLLMVNPSSILVWDWVFWVWIGARLKCIRSEAKKQAETSSRNCAGIFPFVVFIGWFYTLAHARTHTLVLSHTHTHTHTNTHRIKSSS